MGYVAGVLNCLGVERSIAVDLLPAAAVNAGTGGVPPPEFLQALAKATLPSVEEMCQRFEGRSHVWRERLRAALAVPKST